MGSEWQELNLFDLGKIVTGKTPSTRNDSYFGGNVPFVTPRDLDGSRLVFGTERYLSEAGANSVKNAVIPPGAVMVSCIGSDMGKAAIAGKRCVTNQQINSILVEEKFDYKFIYYNLSTRKDEIRGRAGGSAQPILSKGHFGQLDIRLPPLPEQRAIAHILGTLDDKIECNRRMNETLEKMAQAIFKSWFVDFDPVRWNMDAKNGKAVGKPPVPPEILKLFPDSFQESELGLIPKGWEVAQIRELGEVVCGKTPSTKDRDNFGSDVPFITIPDLRDAIFIVKTSRSLSRKGALEQKGKFLPKGALCVSCIATPGLVGITTRDSQTNQQINSIIPGCDVSPYYCFFSLSGLGDIIKSNGSGGSVLLNLSKSRFELLRVLRPANSVHCAFHQNVEHFFDLILNNLNQIDDLSHIRDTLLPKLISGELRIKDAEKFIEDNLP